MINWFKDREENKIKAFLFKVLLAPFVWALIFGGMGGFVRGLYKVFYFVYRSHPIISEVEHWAIEGAKLGFLYGLLYPYITLFAKIKYPIKSLLIMLPSMLISVYYLHLKKDLPFLIVLKDSCFIIFIITLSCFIGELKEYLRVRSQKKQLQEEMSHQLN